VSWQVPNVPANHPPPDNGAPVEASGKVDQITPSITLPTGPFTGAPGCAPANDGTGSVICAVEGTNNGLYGIALHPQPFGGVTAAEATSGLIPLLLPGTVITGKDAFNIFPCDPQNPCNRVASIAGKPSCAGTEGSATPGDGMVICGVLALVQNSDGAASTVLVGIAFNPRAAQVAGSNPAVTLLPLGFRFVGNPSCTHDRDPNGVVNGGKGFAVCAIVFTGPNFGGTAETFGASFDPRSGYFDSVDFPLTGGMFFNSDPSCATPFDNVAGGAMICGIFEGDGAGFGTGTSSVLLGLAWDPIAKTTAMLNLGAPPSGDGSWTGVGCAAANPAFPSHSIVCVATTSGKEVLAVNFDPRTGLSPFTGKPPVFSGNVFSDTNGLPGNPSLSCTTAMVVANQVNCGMVDGAGTSMAFFVPITF
jgi:hypothetical protein